MMFLVSCSEFNSEELVLLLEKVQNAKSDKEEQREVLKINEYIGKEHITILVEVDTLKGVRKNINHMEDGEGIKIVYIDFKKDGVLVLSEKWSPINSENVFDLFLE